MAGDIPHLEPDTPGDPHSVSHDHESNNEESGAHLRGNIESIPELAHGEHSDGEKSHDDKDSEGGDHSDKEGDEEGGEPKIDLDGKHSSQRSEGGGSKHGHKAPSDKSGTPGSKVRASGNFSNAGSNH